jgi:hypothetical protein
MGGMSEGTRQEPGAQEPGGGGSGGVNPRSGVVGALTVDWGRASRTLHARVLTATPNPLVRGLVRLHAPGLDHQGQPVCCGCDQDGEQRTAAVWPCRTYTRIARDLLGVHDVEALLTRPGGMTALPLPPRVPAARPPH